MAADAPRSNCLVACSLVFATIIFPIVTVLLIVACIENTQPDIYIQDLYVPSLVPKLNETTTFNASVFVDFKLKRALTLSRPTYDYFRMNLFYGEYRKNFSLGTHMYPGFRMGWRKRAHKKTVMEAVGMPWQEAIRVTSAGNAVAMAVQLVVNERRVWGGRVVKANVWVDNSGHMVPMNPIKL